MEGITVNNPKISILNSSYSTFNIVNVENLSQNLSDGVFYGSGAIVNPGRFDKYRIYLAGANPGPAESAELRFGLYDSNFLLIREGSLLIDQSTALNEYKDFSIQLLELSQPTVLYFVLGKNDEIGNLSIRCPRIDSNGTPNSDIIFDFNHPAGALPSDISGIRTTGNRVFYNAIYKID